MAALYWLHFVFLAALALIVTTVAGH